MPSKHCAALRTCSHGNVTAALVVQEHPADPVSEGGKKKSPLVLAGDDLLPVFIFLVCQCALPLSDLFPSTCQYMWQLSNQGLLTGECGYYLTVFESALHYIQNWSASRDSPHIDPSSSPADPPQLAVATPAGDVSPTSILGRDTFDEKSDSDDGI
eukprot:SAG31_NODE_1433_length_8368_cov_8.437901_2_plen_156_part_00